MNAPSESGHDDTVTDVPAQKLPILEEAVVRLTVIEGRSVGATLPLVKAQSTVGRHATNDLVLDDRMVSAVHLELNRRGGGHVLVRDTGSTNGTWLGEHRITEAVLAPGAKLRVGDTMLRLEPDPRAAVPATSVAYTKFEGLIGASPEMRELFTVLGRVASRPLSLLIQGEAGTGKEAVARAAHARSPRATMPFVVLDAPSALTESALIGHEAGAMAGADSQYLGAFERANGGTLFIDEVGELPEHIQTKLLQILERPEITRIGGREPVPVDVRVIAGTHRDLRIEIEAKRFREDLYFRLAQVRLVLPPLRARADDIPMLVQHCLEQITEADRKVPAIEQAALEELRRRPFPGNVRELRNVLVRACSLCTDNCIRVADIAGEGFGFRGSEAERSPLDLGGTFSVAKQRAIERFERAYLETLMRRTGNNLSRAAREADLARHHLRDLLKKRGLYVGPAGEPEASSPPAVPHPAHGAGEASS